MHETHHKQTFTPVHIIISVLIGVVLLFNAYQITSVNKLLSGPEAPAKPEIKITLITADCADCFDLAPVYDQAIASAEFDVTDHATLAATDAHAQKLIKDNDITKLPAIVVEGETEKIQLEGFVESKDALVLVAPAPYFDITTGSTRGLVTLQHVLAPATCTTCANLTAIGEQLKQFGVAIVSETKFTPESEDGKRLIQAYGITKLPAVILSEGAKEYDMIVQTWKQVGDVAPDGSYVLRQINPPYYDLASQKVKGAVSLTNIVDASCATCYNVSLHKSILTNFGVVIAMEKTLDISSMDGKQLVSQYNISKVPTIIMTGDQALYPSLMQVWLSVGSVEKDGAYVFRSIDQLQMPYKDLVTGKIVGGK